MVAYTKPQQKEEIGGKLRGDGAKIKFIYFICERGQLVGFRKGSRGLPYPPSQLPRSSAKNSQHVHKDCNNSNTKMA